MNEKKIVFLDVDGTIYARPGFIPESARQAIAQARENGHLLYLSTGRSRSETPKDIWELGFDGIVGAAGAYVEHEGSLIFNEHLPQADLWDLYCFLEDNEIAYTIETNDKIYGTRQNIERQNEYFEAWFQGSEEGGELKECLKLFDSITETVEDIREVPDVNKVLFYDAPFSIEEVSRIFAGHFMVVGSSIGQLKGVSAEVYSPIISKATGMQKILEHIGAGREDTIAFGDGGNDMEMIAYAGIGIAMGNGKEALKEAADYVTEEALNDGLYKGFKKFGLI